MVPLQTAFLLLNVILLHKVHTDSGMCKMHFVLAVYRATIHWNIFSEFQSLAYLCHTILNGMKSDEALVAETNFVFQVLFLLQSSLCCLRDLYDDRCHRTLETCSHATFSFTKKLHETFIYHTISSLVVSLTNIHIIINTLQLKRLYRNDLN